jgi:hypothetical protein
MSGGAILVGILAVIVISLGIIGRAGRWDD